METFFQSDIESARGMLMTARAKLDAEIRTYPRPVAGCDDQFNHMLAERQRCADALRALEAQIHIATPRAP
ncbi:MAG: hypothetical protein AAGE18_06060 [Pseudomonadota bacterium]